MLFQEKTYEATVQYFIWERNGGMNVIPQGMDWNFAKREKRAPRWLD